jgi:hypothetical protein
MDRGNLNVLNDVAQTCMQKALAPASALQNDAEA